MSDRDWGRIAKDWRVAIFGVVGVFVILLGGWQTRPKEFALTPINEYRQDHTETHSEHSAAVTCNSNCQVHFDFGGDGDEAQAAPQNAEAEHYSAKEIALADYSQQRRMAHWTVVVAFLTGYGAILLIGTLVEAYKGTDAAGKAVSAQIGAERPIMQIQNLSVARDRIIDVSEQEQVLLHLTWSLKNYGKTACWLQKTSFNWHVGTELPPVPDKWTIVDTAAFLGPTGSIQNKPNVVPNVIVEGDFLKNWRPALNIIKTGSDFFPSDSPKFYVFGFSEYRDAGGLVWQTHFIFEMFFDNNLNSKHFQPVASAEHWADRIKNPKS